MWPSALLFAEDCPHQGHFYQENGYIVTKITVEAPLDFTHEVRRFADGQGLELQARSPGGSNGAFNHLAFLTSASDIGSTLNTGYRVSVSFVVPVLQNCDDTKKTLEALYRVYHLGTPVDASGANYSLQFPPIKIGSKTLSQVLSIQPGVGYDAARHFFGGGELSLRSTANTPVDDFSVIGYGSSSSIQLQAQLSGRRTWQTGPISNLNYGVAYVDNGLPTGPYWIHEKQLSARLAGVARVKDRLGLDLHFGVALDGGNQNSAGPEVQRSVGVLHSPTGSLKMYVGSTWTHYATAISASYGLQLGTAQSGVDLDFAKQILNASISTHFLPVDHHSLAVDASLRAGWLTTYGTIPLAERFFGGNVLTPFIPGDAWVIQGNPILRSFPARNYTVSDGAYGGTSFFSVNANLAYAVWARPLVPKRIADEVQPLLSGQLKTFRNVTADSYVSDGAPYRALETVLSGHASSMAELRKRLQSMKVGSGSTTDLSSSVDDALGDLDDVDDQMRLLGTRNASADALSPYFNLVVGEGPIKGNLLTLADDLTTVVGQFESSGQSSDHDYLLEVVKELQSLHDSALAQFKAIDRKPSEAKADAALKFPSHILSELMGAVNLYSISPTVLFDAARLGPQPPTGGEGTRYGIGPAIRFGLVNVDFTVGYSFNVQQKPGDPRGAAVFGLSFENLF